MSSLSRRPLLQVRPRRLIVMGSFQSSTLSRQRIPGKQLKHGHMIREFSYAVFSLQTRANRRVDSFGADAHACPAAVLDCRRRLWRMQSSFGQTFGQFRWAMGLRVRHMWTHKSNVFPLLPMTCLSSRIQEFPTCICRPLCNPSTDLTSRFREACRTVARPSAGSRATTSVKEFCILATMTTLLTCACSPKFASRTAFPCFRSA